MRKSWPVAVVGAGPAGISCALQLRRYGHDCVVFERKKIGGMAVNARWIENLLAFPGGISGPDFVRRMQEQVSDWRITVLIREIREIRKDRKNGGFHLTAGDYNIQVRRLVVATGSSPLRPDFLPKAPAYGVAYEIEELRDMEGCRIVVLGGGDLAFDYALSLAENNEVTILCRSGKMKALKQLIQAAHQIAGISVRCPVTVQRLAYRGQKLCLTLSGGKEQVEADRLVIAIGRRPELGCLTPDLLQERELLEKDGRLWIIGDAGHPLYRQISIAAGDGLRTAMALHTRLQETGGR
jgi:thioredoxin reductase